MKKDCKKLLDHISRLQGQLTRLQKDIESGDSCENVIRLALSSSKSFDTLRAKIVEGYIESLLLESKRPSPKTLQQLTTVYSLIKA